jgi:hypothetical protein
MRPPTGHVSIVVPVCDDWSCLRILAPNLARVLGAAGWTHSIFAVDDGSRETARAGADSGAPVVIRLVRNVGHQRAIAVGLEHVLRTADADRIAVMDADGEDRPEDLARLLAASHAAGEDAAGTVVVARRRKRSEGRRFTAFYSVYKAAFRLLTGETIDFGNFCVLDRRAARRLVAMYELWLNLPATVMRSRLTVVRVPTDRGRRYAGRSRMKLVGLVIHGLSAVGVFSERAFTRTLIAAGGVVALMLLGLLVGLLLKLLGLATPGWVTTLATALVVVVIQSATVAMTGLFVVFGNAANVVRAPAATAQILVEHIDVAAGQDADIVAPALEAAGPQPGIAGVRAA